MKLRGVAAYQALAPALLLGFFLYSLRIRAFASYIIIL